MNLDNIGKDCPCYEFDGSEPIFDIGEFNALSPNDGKLTIEVNGVKVGDFSANQPEDETINIQVVTQTDIDNAVSAEAELRRTADQNLQGSITDEETARINADKGLQSQIDTIVSKSDVVDIVATYAALLAYDTSKLGDNDVLEVLSDETHDNAVSYYRWNKGGNTWVYIGSLSPSYTKAETDALLNQKQNVLTAGDHIDITGNTISVDTTDLVEKSELDDYYTKTETDTKLEPKLEVDVVETLTAQGEEGKIYLTPKAHTTQTATGNPITATITDGAGQIEDFQLDGDTFQQSYSGKNLYKNTLPNISGTCTVVYKDSTITLNGARGTGNLQNTSNIGTRLAAGTYTIRAFLLGGSASGNGTRLITRIADNIFTVRSDISGASESLTVTLGSDTDVTLQIWVDNSTTFNNFKIGYQIEVGSATDYEPYVGGIASPNPDYPQPIQVVTGTQTIVINGTNYPLDLGTIELCKLGTYQDYIYKDGDTWKVHNAMSKVLIDGTAGTISNPSINRFNLDGCITGYKKQANSSFALCDQYISIGQTDNNAQFNTNASGYENCINFGSAIANVIRFKNTKISTSDDFADALEAHPLTMYYALATATDTAITDMTLISQLNAIASASLETGTNTLTNSATGSNLAGDMEVDYFGYDPTNRYDKWLWLDIDNAYEKLGS